jgi:membrane-bound lytic murein transglycosylase MltF
LTCAIAVAACSAPAPTASGAGGTATGHPRTAVAEASSEPAPSAKEIALASTPATGDFDSMTSRGTIRVLVARSQTNYSIDEGRQYGSAFDAGKAFESFVGVASGIDGLRVKVVFIPMTPEQLLSALTSGRGDLIAGRFAKTFDNEDVVAFSEPIVKDVREVLVTGPGVAPIVSLEDVAGRSIHVRRDSDHFASLTRLNGQLAKIDKPVCKIVAMDPSLTDEDLLRMVNDGRVPVTLVDQYLVAAWRPQLDKIAVNPDVSVSQDGVYAWAVRKDSPKLLGLVNEFLRTHDLQSLDARSIARWQQKH